MSNCFFPLAACSGLLAVGLGAFGAHGLREKLAVDAMAIYQTAVNYHFWHTLALFGIALLMMLQPGSRWLSAAGWSFVLGLLVFCGSLYFMAISGVRYLGALPVGMITPLGGMAFMLGWLLLLVAWSRNFS